MELVLSSAATQLASVAELAPHRATSLGQAGGAVQIFAHDARSGRSRQVTRRRQGTTVADIAPDGRHIWWFDDDLAGVGRWRRQPFSGGSDELVLPGIMAGAHAGLALACDETAAIGVQHADRWTVYLRDPAGAVRAVLDEPGAGEAIDVLADGAGPLLVVAGDPSGPHAVRVLDQNGTPLHILSGVSGALWCSGFAPDARQPRLLVVKQTPDGYLVGTWTADEGVVLAEWTPFDTEISASWCPDGRVLVRQDRRARSSLHVLDLGARQRHTLATPAGTILDARARARGQVDYLWTDQNTPPERRCTDVVAPQHPSSSPVEDLHVPSPSGPIHALLSAPAAGSAPWPTVFLVHGGPHTHDRDAYDPVVSVLTGAGLAVVRVNYRGSTGYGPGWKNAWDEGVGHTQLADLAAVRRQLCEVGLARPDQIGLAGWSWGGYLSLLGAGVQPELWCAAAAVYPIADYVAAYESCDVALRLFDQQLFGGTPAEVPDRYRRASPITYVADVRAPCSCWPAVTIRAARWGRWRTTSRRSTRPTATCG